MEYNKNSAQENIFLEAKDIVKIYGSTIAVNHVNIQVHKGEVLALVGANGAGKSTITKILSGVVTCNEGEIRIDGAEINTKKIYSCHSKNKGDFCRSPRVVIV